MSGEDMDYTSLVSGPNKLGLHIYGSGTQFLTQFGIDQIPTHKDWVLKLLK